VVGGTGGGMQHATLENEHARSFSRVMDLLYRLVNNIEIVKSNQRTFKGVPGRKSRTGTWLVSPVMGSEKKKGPFHHFTGIWPQSIEFEYIRIYYCIYRQQDK